MEEGRIRLRLPNQETWLFHSSLAAPRIEESVFFPTSDRSRKTEQIVLAFNTRETTQVRWCFEQVVRPTPTGRDASPSQ
jgi:uncharacterized heparinase superfamily protein